MRHKMWAKATEADPWHEYVVTEDGKHYIDGAEVEPFDFKKIHDTAYRVDELRSEVDQPR